MDNRWARPLAYVTGLVNQRLLLQCEYLIAENRILRSHLSGRLRLADSERSTLAEIGKRLDNIRPNIATCYMTPKDMLAGRQQEIHAERDRKLEAALKQR